MRLFGGRGITQTGIGRFVEHVGRFLVLRLRCLLIPLYGA